MRLDEHLHLIRNVPDFPKPGILFKDITPLLANGPALRAAIDDLIDATAGMKPDVILGVESRGFLFASPMAYATARGVILVRKPGKLPARVIRQEYALEYGTDRLEVHKDAITPGARVLVLDDVLATGGTASAVVSLVERLGGVVAGVGFVIELDFLNGRSKLGSHEIFSLLHY